MILTDEERTKFMKYLEVSMNSCIQMALQFEKIVNVVGKEMADKERRKASACMLLLTDLRNTETMTVR